MAKSVSLHIVASLSLLFLLIQQRHLQSLGGGGTSTDDATVNPTNNHLGNLRVVLPDLNPPTDDAHLVADEQQPKREANNNNNLEKNTDSQPVMATERPEEPIPAVEPKPTQEAVQPTEPLFHMILTTIHGSLSTLNIRSIESIFYHHPQATLILHCNAETVQNAGLDPGVQPLLDLGYNIRVDYYNPVETLNQAMQVSGNNILDQALANQWVSKISHYQKEDYWYSNETNLMRLCIIYLQGGIYLDTDVVLINDQLGNNPHIDDTVGADTGDHFGNNPYIQRKRRRARIHNSVIKFTKPHNPFLMHVLNDMFQNYNGTKWGHNGPEAYERTIHSNKNRGMTCPDITGHLTAPPKKTKNCLVHKYADACAPIGYDHWDEVCFQDNSPSYEDLKPFLKNSVAVHFNNKKTGDKLKNKEYKPDSLCAHVLQDYCITCREDPK